MERRTFYVALGIPRGEDTEMVRLAYRKVVDRYRLELEEEHFDDPTQPPLSFSVLRSYSERRHASVFDAPEGAVGEAEVDSFFHGYVPDVLPPKAKRAGKDLYVELRLTKDEAKQGGIFPVHIPVVTRCPACESDKDEEHALTCRLCAGRRRVTEDHLVEVTSPPGVRDGQTARVAMEDVGLGATDLIINVLIG
jgi:DnaJ-class molecular chaperone